MILRKKRVRASPEQTLAIGLIWGHLNARQFDEAYQLARGCAVLWPEDQRMALMAAYAAVELAEPLEDQMVQAMKGAGYSAWTSLIWRRAYSPADAVGAAAAETRLDHHADSTHHANANHDGADHE